MSFQDTQWNIEQTVIQPLLNFRTKVSPLNQIHNDSVNAFAKIMDGLLTGSDGEMAMQGQGSMALANLVGQFLGNEEKLSGSGADLMGRLLDASVICEKCAHELQQSLDQIAGQQDHSVQDLSAIALAADTGAVAQGGLDVPWDVIALGITAIAATYVATHNPDATKIQNAELVKAGEIAIWKNGIQNGPDIDPMSELPPDPEGPTGNSGNFLRMIGITGGIAALIATGAIIVNLTTEQEDLAQRLYADFGSSGLTLDDIRAIIADNPKLTEAQLRDLLKRYAGVIKNYPNLVKQYGALAVFMSFIALSAYDPAHGGNYPARIPVVEQKLEKRTEEAEALLGAAEAGAIPWPLTPSTVAAYEATDANGQQWDVKAWRSGVKPAFSVAKALTTVEDEVKAGENILVNDKYMSNADRQALDKAIKGAGLERNVLWWPDQP